MKSESLETVSVFCLSGNNRGSVSDRQVANIRYRLKKAGEGGKSWAEQFAKCVEEVNREYEAEKVVFKVILGH